MIQLSLYQNVLWTLDVQFAGRTRRFFFDTGAGVSCIAQALAAEEELDTWGRISGFRMSGRRMDMARCDNVTLAIGGRTFHHESMGIVDFAGLLPPDWPATDGIIALSTLAEQAFTLDFTEHTLSFENDQSLTERTETMQPLSIRLARVAGGLSLGVFVAVDVGGRYAWFELDTGNTGPAIVAPHIARELGWPQAKHEEEERVGALRTLRLYGAAEVRTATVVRDIIYDGNLGRSFFDGTSLCFDLKRGRLWYGTR